MLRLAGLIDFRRINGMQANALARNLNRISIHHVQFPPDLRLCGGKGGGEEHAGKK